MESLAIHHPIPQIPVIIRMPGYSQLKETGKTWVSFRFTVNLYHKPNAIFGIDSPFHKISPMTMCLHVTASGGHYLGKTTHLSVYLYATQGEQEFNGYPENEFDIKLLDPTDKEQHHIATISRGHTFLTGFFMYEIISWLACYGGIEEFISLDSLKPNSPFLSDDCLYFQVTEHDSH